MAYKNKEEYKKYQKRYHIENREKLRKIERDARLSRDFNLSREQYDTLLIKQNRVCALCSKPETYKRQGRIIELAVDHDRKCCAGNKSCGKCVRGLLCGNCNRFIIGYIERMAVNPERIMKYLVS